MKHDMGGARGDLHQGLLRGSILRGVLPTARHLQASSTVGNLFSLMWVSNMKNSMRSQKFPCFSCSFFGFPGACDLMCAVFIFQETGSNHDELPDQVFSNGTAEVHST